jgi:hypothetical protein
MNNTAGSPLSTHVPMYNNNNGKNSTGSAARAYANKTLVARISMSSLSRLRREGDKMYSCYTKLEHRRA